MKRVFAVLLIESLAGLLIACVARNVSVHVTDAAADRVFADMVRQTGMNFVYPAGLLDGLTISVSADDEPMDQVLRRMFDGTDIKYRIKGNNVVLARIRQAAAVRRQVTVRGFVRAAGSAEVLAGAVVTAVPGGSTSANVNGFYSLTLPAGTISLHVSYPGYDSVVTADFRIGADTRRDFLLAAARELDEVEVVATRNGGIALESADLGHYNLSTSSIDNVPGLLGESDMVKALQMQPGVTSGMEGLAGMHVHGGSADENLYMLDNIPLYQVNHLAGLFSAFNTSAIRNVDFYKSSFPARYDGRLSSFTDVHTRDGSLSAHHGSLRIGNTAASLGIDGPIRSGRTSYLLSVRRTWHELVALPILAMVNADEEEKTDFGYMFMDVNAKINHHFSDRSRAYIMFYYGYDRLHGGSEGTFTFNDGGWYDKDDTRLRWGNTVLSAGWNYILSPKIFGEFTAAYSRYGSSMANDMLDRQMKDGEIQSSSHSVIKSDNNITDWIFRTDFDWRPDAGHRVGLGASYTRHSFLPSRATRMLSTDNFHSEVTDSAWTYGADEFNVYAGDDWTVNDRVRVSAGLHFSLFGIDGMLHSGISPRLSVRYAPSSLWAIKGGYSRAVQYVHQLTQSFISLPSDQWVPVTGSFKPQSCDKLSAGLYHLSANGRWSLEIEGFYKWMHNLIEYVDEYYLVSPKSVWDSRLTAGRGSARGMDIKLTKATGRLTGHIGYSLLWADRTFAGKNGGRKYPARFDNRHKITLLINWKASSKWEINALWTGMTGNRVTLPTQMWNAPGFYNDYGYEVPLRSEINNYRLPFYHRLDLNFRRNTRHGYWNFGFYNAYCHMNAVGVRRGTVYPGERRVFQQIHLLPLILSISYTWQF